MTTCDWDRCNMSDKSENAYLRRLVNRVCPPNSNFSKLFTQMNNTPFLVLNEYDNSRVSDGLLLRDQLGCVDCGRPCSILEMLVALAIRIEDQITVNDRYGDRAGQWFWEMIVNMGVGGMTNDNYDEGLVTEVLLRFNNRQYNYDGSNGGIFVIPDPPNDLRNTDIWYQANWYLSRLYRSGKI